jgi:hypothetical protein
VCKADDGAPPSIGLDMTQQPDRRRAGVASEDRIFGGILTDQCRQILRVNDAAAPNLGAPVGVSYRARAVNFTSPIAPKVMRWRRPRCGSRRSAGISTRPKSSSVRGSG